MIDKVGYAVALAVALTIYPIAAAGAIIWCAILLPFGRKEPVAFERAKSTETIT